jgi:hypothetical protein
MTLYRAPIEKAAALHGVDPNLVEVLAILDTVRAEHA